MIPNKKCKKVRIHITTYQYEDIEVQTDKTMNDNDDNQRMNKSDRPKFVCSICLNRKPENNEDTTKRKTNSCPLCRKQCGSCIENRNADTNTVKEQMKTKNSAKVKTRTVQTSETEVAQGLNLLNEVLTVFQSKKLESSKETSRTVLFKDACVSTENNSNDKRFKTKLTVSKVLQFSIEEEKLCSSYENCKFVIVNSYQPEKITKSAIDLIKHKSSSIPQMKMEELKKSLKDKPKAKDTIEEVNRMFATVYRKDTYNNIDDINRPVVRNGPRVLPVVKTKNYVESIKKDSKTCCTRKYNCKCCQMNNYCMSSGDSFRKNECGHYKYGEEDDKQQCSKGVYRCCQLNRQAMQTGMTCECCQNKKDYTQNDEIEEYNTSF